VRDFSVKSTNTKLAHLGLKIFIPVKYNVNLIFEISSHTYNVKMLINVRLILNSDISHH
jgi:hypothetical protein